MRPTLRTFGGVLSPGFASYHVVTGVTLCHPSSDRLPSILIGPVARAMCNISPASLDWASSASGRVSRHNRKAAAIRVFNVIGMSSEFVVVGGSPTGEAADSSEAITGWVTRKAVRNPTSRQIRQEFAHL